MFFSLFDETAAVAADAPKLANITEDVPDTMFFSLFDETAAVAADAPKLGNISEKLPDDALWSVLFDDTSKLSAPRAPPRKRESGLVGERMGGRGSGRGGGREEERGSSGGRGRGSVPATPQLKPKANPEPHPVPAPAVTLPATSAILSPNGGPWHLYDPRSCVLRTFDKRAPDIGASSVRRHGGREKFLKVPLSDGAVSHKLHDQTEQTQYRDVVDYSQIEELLLGSHIRIPA